VVDMGLGIAGEMGAVLIRSIKEGGEWGRDGGEQGL
jgi:hypothetical protein